MRLGGGEGGAESLICLGFRLRRTHGDERQQHSNTSAATGGSGNQGLGRHGSMGGGGGGLSYRGPLAVWTVALTHLKLIGHEVDLPDVDEVGGWALVRAGVVAVAVYDR